MSSPMPSPITERQQQASYQSTSFVQDWDLLELEHGTIVDRNACIFCHVGIFRNGAFIIDQVCAPSHRRRCIFETPIGLSLGHLPYFQRCRSS